MVNELDSLDLNISKGVALVTVNRPEKRNALNSTVRSELAGLLAALRDHDDARVIILTGAGDKAFIAGADINEFAQRTPVEQRAVMAERTVFEEIAAFPKPIIAMINGFALGGGCEIAIACDIRIAARSARLGQPEIKLGLIPGGGGTQRLPRLIGSGRAMKMILTGELIDAEEAERIGLVDEVVDDDQLAARTMELAKAMAAQSTLTLRLAKAAIRAAEDMPLTAGLSYERELFITAFSSDDKREGVDAFLAKRTPKFTGK
jgi:enoyl-CoA hydratase